MDLSSRKLAVTHKESDYMCLFPATGWYDDIYVLALMHDYALCFRQCFRSSYIVSVHRRRFIVQRIRGFLHFFTKSVYDGFVFSIKKFLRTFYTCCIFLPADFAAAHSSALVYMVVQTWPETLREIHSGASLKRKAAVQQIHYPVDRPRITVRPVIPAAVLFHDTSLDDPGEFLRGYLDIRIGLVVSEQHVVFWSVFLYQVALQYERFHFAACGYVFELGDILHHAPDLGIHMSR